MKHDEAPRTRPARINEMTQIGAALVLLRKAVGMTQGHAAERAGISRSTAALIEKGDGGRTMFQVLRYLDALSPQTSLQALLRGELPAVKNLRAQALPQRIRTKKTTTQEDKYDF